MTAKMRVAYVDAVALLMRGDDEESVRELAERIARSDNAVEAIEVLQRLVTFYMEYYGEHVTHRDEVAFHGECATEWISRAWREP